MAQRVQYLLIDDLDGSEAVETVVFGLDGVGYEIDLSADHAGQLREALGQWIPVARKSAAKQTARGRGRAQSSTDTAAIREWAKEQGYEVNARGRLSAEVKAAYAAAH